MSYYANQYDAAFEIAGSDVDRACALLGLEPSRDGLLTAIEDLGFEVFIDGTGGIDGVCFGGGKYFDRVEETLSALAPVVEDGSHIDFIGEDNYIWRLAFQDGKKSVMEGTLTFS